MPKRITDRTEDRPVARECAWCGAVIELRPRGRHQRYCGQSCRQRAYEVRTANSRQESATAAGDARDPAEPVRELVERHTVRTVVRTVTQTQPVPVQSGPRLDTGRGAAQAIEAIAHAVASRRIEQHDHRRIYTALRGLLGAIDATHPGGLDNLRGRKR